MRNKEKEIEFYAWYTENWLKSGGLISQATAARLLNKSTGRIAQMIKEGKIKEYYQFENLSFVAFPEIMKEARKEIFKRCKKEIQEGLKDIAENIPEDQRD